MPNTQLTSCSHPKCDVTFQRRVYDLKRIAKRGGKPFCSVSCATKYKNSTTPKTEGMLASFRNMMEERNVLRKRTPEHKGLVYLLCACRNRWRDGRRQHTNRDEFNLDIDYLKELWSKQRICPYTGVELIVPIAAVYGRGLNNKLYTASIDRIDSTKWYVKGNIQFVSIAANNMKNNMSDEDVKTLCGLIAKHHTANT